MYATQCCEKEIQSVKALRSSHKTFQTEKKKANLHYNYNLQQTRRHLSSMKTSLLFSTVVLVLSTALVLTMSTSAPRRLGKPQDRRVNTQSVLNLGYINNRLVPTGEMTPAVRVTSRSMSFAQFCSSVTVSIYSAADA
jgi:hypothetical protein